MSKDDEEKHPLVRFDNTTLVKIKPGQSTLPIDTAAEWSNGFVMINDVISLLKDDIFAEKYEDEVGEKRTRHYIPPQLLQWVQERRRMQDQIFKMMGGEALVEGKKQVMKNLADMIFEMGKDVATRDEKEEFIKKIIDTEFADVFNDESN